MKKGQLTRQFILEKTAPVFNKRGYGNTTLDDIKEATGLEKGGIYRHFSGKEEIAAEAFDYACYATFQHQVAALAKIDGGFKKLIAALEGFYSHDNPIGGGCPIFNTAVENDDGNPLLKKKALISYRKMVKELASLVELAKEEGTLRKDVEADVTAAFLLSAVEGGLIARNLTGKDAVGENVISELRAYLDTKKPVKKVAK